MRDTDTYHARDAGQRLAETLCTSLARPDVPNFDWATCTGPPITSDGRKLLPVVWDGTEMKVPYTTNCASALADNRVLLLTSGHLTTAIAILAQ